MAVDTHGCFVHLIRLFPHYGAPMGQVVLALFNSHLFNLVHLARQSVGVVRFFDLELGLGDD